MSQDPTPGDAVLAELGTAGLALWTYWQSRSRPDHVPFRWDFDPMALGPHLPVMGMLDFEAPGSWRIRLVGTGIRDWAGFHLTGTNYLDLVAPGQREREDRVLTAAIERPCGLFLLRDVVRATGLIYRARMLRLPLRDAEGRIRLLIAASDEAPNSSGSAGPDTPPVTTVASRFIDIGAGVPDGEPRGVGGAP